MEGVELNALARSLADLDQNFLHFLKSVFRKLINGRVLTGDDVAAQVQARYDLADIERLESQFSEITTGEYYFCELYLSDRHILYYWEKFFSALHQIFDVAEETGDDSDIPYLDYLADMINKALKVESLLIECASKDLLSPEFLSVFGERWDPFNECCERRSTKLPRMISTW